MKSNNRGFLAICTVLLCMFASLSHAEVLREAYGTTTDGKPVEAFTLENANGMTFRALSLGALIDEISVPDRDGEMENVVVALPGLADYEASSSFNRVIGRFANRIAEGRFSIDGVDYQLPVNNRGMSIHGGETGFGRQVWQGSAVSGEDGESVVFTLTSPDGEGGFPGRMDVSVTYRLGADNSLTIDYQAEVDKPTVINLTQHAYFNLAGNSSRDVYGHVLQIAADEYTPSDGTGIPTGEYASVEGTPFDLRKPDSVRSRIASAHPHMLQTRGFDHNFVLSRTARDKPEFAARLFDPESGRIMDVLTTEPGLQVFTANGMDGSRLNAAGTALRQSYAIALETQHFPDSPNKPQFPSTVVRPGEQFRSTTILVFSVSGADVK